MQTFSAFRKLSCRKGRLTFSYRDIISIGIMQLKRDIQELQYDGQDSTIKELGKGFLRMVIGCTIILILAQIPFQIGKKQREREVQQMKEQQYEDLKNKADNRN